MPFELADVERAQKWGLHPLISDDDPHKDLTFDQVERMGEDSDTYVYQGTGIIPDPAQGNYGLQILAATYHLASQFAGIFKGENAIQDAIDLEAIANSYITKINEGVGVSVTGPGGAGGDSPRLQVLVSPYRNYRLNPNRSPYTSQF